MPSTNVRRSDEAGEALVNSHGPEWREWIVLNVRAGCRVDDMVRDMVAAGWTASSAQAAIAYSRRSVAGVPLGSARPALPGAGLCTVDGRQIAVTMRLADPAIAICDNVLSTSECTQLLRYAEERGLVSSTVVDARSGAATPHPERTSRGLMLARAETPLISVIERRLAALTGWPVENGEGLQILHYAPGQEYRPHFDAFPSGPAGDVHTARGGQRVCTTLVYLKSPERGGGTAFPNLGLTVRPEPGAALIFHNVDPAGQRANSTLHAGLPVEAGEKVVLTYWQRQRDWS